MKIIEVNKQNIYMDTEFYSYDTSQPEMNFLDYSINYFVVILPELAEADYYNKRIRIHLNTPESQEIFYRVEIHALSDIEDNYGGWCRTYKNFQSFVDFNIAEGQKAICVYSNSDLIKVNEIRRLYDNDGSATISVGSLSFGMPIINQSICSVKIGDTYEW